jgi:hypothetical protein
MLANSHILTTLVHTSFFRCRTVTENQWHSCGPTNDFCWLMVITFKSPVKVCPFEFSLLISSVCYIYTLAVDTVNHTGQALSEVTGKDRYPGPPRWGWASLTSSPHRSLFHNCQQWVCCGLKTGWSVVEEETVKFPQKFFQRFWLYSNLEYTIPPLLFVFLELSKRKNFLPSSTRTSCCIT